MFILPYNAYEIFKETLNVHLIMYYVYQSSIRTKWNIVFAPYQWVVATGLAFLCSFPSYKFTNLYCYLSLWAGAVAASGGIQYACPLKTRLGVVADSSSFQDGYTFLQLSMTNS